MPTSYVNATFRNTLDALYDPTSVVLSDPTGAYGVKLNSDDSVIVDDATAMTKLSTGRYQYSFDSVASAEYTAYIEFVTGGETYWVPRIITATSTTGTTTSGYSEFAPDDIVTYVKAYLGGSPSDATALAHVQAGYMSVMSAMDTRLRPPRRHFWNCLEPVSTVVFWATAAGTMTVSGTTITDSTNSPFYESMVGATLKADTSGTEYTITAYTSSSVITVSAAATADNLDTFTITADGYYAPPGGFRGFKNKPVFAYSAASTRSWSATSGTMAVTGGTTVTDSTNKPFRSTMVGAVIVSTNGNYTITAYTSTSIVTVASDASADDGNAFTMVAGSVTTSSNLYDLVEESPERIRTRWRDSDVAGYTQYWALEPKTFVAATGQQFRFLVAPVPQQDMSVDMRVRLRLADVTATGVRFFGGDSLSLAIRDAALADAELVTGHVGGEWAQRAQVSLWSAIDADRMEMTTQEDQRIVPG